MACVKLSFQLHLTSHLTTPRAHTPYARRLDTFGLYEDWAEAALIALEAMGEMIAQQYGLAQHNALGLASVVVDLRITQLANGVCGVHALLPHDAIVTTE